MPPRSTVLAAALVLLVALAVRFAFWSEIRGTALDRWHLWEQTDMATYLEQARQLAEEDWLAREPHHPYHGWQGVAPPERWLEWYGPHAFHQAPAYSYVLAALDRALDDPLPLVKAVQLVLGAGSCVLVFWIAAHLGGLLAGCAAGGLAALYGPLLYLEPQLLREGPALFGLLAILALLLRHVDRPPDTPRRVALAAGGLGVAIGLYHTFHEMGQVLGAVALVALVARHARPRARRAGLAAAALLAGYLIGFAPLLARNVTVGAPPLSVSCRTTINLVESVEAHAREGGARFFPPGPRVAEILDRSGGRLLRALPLLWQSYGGDVGWMLRNWSKRFAIVWQKWEEADNTSLYFYEAMTRTLRPLPDFRVAFPAGFAGAALVLAGAIAGRRRTARSPGNEPGPATSLWRRAPAGHATMLVYLAGVAGSLSMVHTVARFRLYLVPFFLIYAGVGLALLVRAARERRWVALAALPLLVLAGWSLQGLATSRATFHAPRPADFATASRLALEEDELDLARRVAEHAARWVPGDPTYFAQLGWHLEQRGDPAAAAECYARALALQPRSGDLRQALERTSRAARRP